MKKEWFKVWFASRFYDLLYKHRDENEARIFVNTIINKLKPNPNYPVLDLACGKGRHSIAFAMKNFNVVGIDITERFINEAKNKAKKLNLNNITFLTGDIRNFNLNKQSGVILNAFTSFGYFDNIEDNIKILNNVRKHLNPEGTFILDYLNKKQVLKAVAEKPEMTITEQGIKFNIKKETENGFVCKYIEITTPEGKNEHFYEKVKLFSKEELHNLITNCGLEVKDIWGDYYGSSYFEEAPRMIFICEKV